MKFGLFLVKMWTSTDLQLLHINFVNGDSGYKKFQLAYSQPKMTIRIFFMKNLWRKNYQEQVYYHI